MLIPGNHDRRTTDNVLDPGTNATNVSAVVDETATFANPDRHLSDGPEEPADQANNARQPNCKVYTVGASTMDHEKLDISEVVEIRPREKSGPFAPNITTCYLKKAKDSIPHYKMLTIHRARSGVV